MARSIIASPNPELLAWARQTSGLDIAKAARRIGLDVVRLQAWERGESAPTVARLRKAAEVYKRPLAVFYLPKPPPDVTPLHDFRRLPAGIPQDFSPKLRLLLRRIRDREERIIEILREQGAETPDFVGSATLDDDQDALATRARDVLGIRVEDQHSWRDADEALRRWTEACEDAGIFIFQSSDVDVEEMRGFALTNAVAPIIVMNAKDAPSARVFTLFHEFTHIMLGMEGISNLHVPGQSRDFERRTEIFCNAVAAEILVPARDFEPRVRSIAAAAQLDQSLRPLARLYKVSQEVIARRLMELRFIGRDAYEAQRDRLRREFEESRRNVAVKGHPSYVSLVFRNNGRAFTRLVLGAHGENLITARDVSSLLNINLRHLAKVEAKALAAERLGAA